MEETILDTPVLKGTNVKLNLSTDPVVIISQSNRNRYSDCDESNLLPDLIVDTCPLGCTRKCDESWINEQIAHRIICKCRCHHKRKLFRREVRND